MNYGTNIETIDFNIYYHHKKTCLVCGNEFHFKRKGRIREYCSDECKDFYKFKNALERTIIKIDFKNGFSNQAKGDLFALANLIKLCKKSKICDANCDTKIIK